MFRASQPFEHDRGIVMTWRDVLAVKFLALLAAPRGATRCLLEQRLPAQGRPPVARSVLATSGLPV